MSDLKDDPEPDEPMLWDELEEQYGRPLTLIELRNELDLLYGLPVTNAEFEAELESQAKWKVLKTEIAKRDADNCTFVEMELTAAKMASEIFDIVFCEKSDGSGETASFEEMNEVIKKNINVFSLFVFTDLISSNAALQRTFKGHLKRYRAIEFVQAEWLKHRNAYGGNKTAFSLVYCRRVFIEMNIKISQKQMREVWLRDTPVAGKQAGLPATG